MNILEIYTLSKSKDILKEYEDEKFRLECEHKTQMTNLDMKFFDNLIKIYENPILMSRIVDKLLQENIKTIRMTLAAMFIAKEAYENSVYTIVYDNYNDDDYNYTTVKISELNKFHEIYEDLQDEYNDFMEKEFTCNLDYYFAVFILDKKLKLKGIKYLEMTEQNEDYSAEYVYDILGSFEKVFLAFYNGIMKNADKIINHIKNNK